MGKGDKEVDMESSDVYSSISGGYRELIKEYSMLIKEHFGKRLKAICLFGSVARGEENSESDIDILVVADGLLDDIGARVKETNHIHEKLKNTEAYIFLRKSGRW